MRAIPANRFVLYAVLVVLLSVLVASFETIAGHVVGRWQEQARPLTELAQ